MELRINGQSRTYLGAPSISALLEWLGLPERAVLVELNGTALRRVEWPDAPLREGDVLEIIRIVAGG